MNTASSLGRRLQTVARAGSYPQQRHQRVWLPATCSTHVNWRIRSTLKSLDDILGSRDDFESPAPDSQTLEQKVQDTCFVPCCALPTQQRAPLAGAHYTNVVSRHTIKYPLHTAYPSLHLAVAALVETSARA